MTDPEIKVRLGERLVGTAVAGLTFLLLCRRLGSPDVSGDARILSGPARFLSSSSLDEWLFGAILTGTLLSCIFAVGVWRNGTTILLAILGSLAWLGLGFLFGLIESLASC
jgi:hypothetical protein